MRMKRVIKTVAAMGILSAVVLASGCAHTPGGIAASTTPIEGRKYVNLGRVVSTDSRLMLFGLIPLTGSNTTREAIDAAVKGHGGDAMINVTVESYSQFWFVLTRLVTNVDGDVIRFE
jgi:hypothetical protein